MLWNPPLKIVLNLLKPNVSKVFGCHIALGFDPHTKDFKVLTIMNSLNSLILELRNSYAKS
jgi:hypothetical protein